MSFYTAKMRGAAAMAIAMRNRMQEPSTIQFDEADGALDAALDLLNREALTEAAAKGMARGSWDDCDEETREIYRGDATAALTAIGLIPAEAST